MGWRCEFGRGVQGRGQADAAAARALLTASFHRTPVRGRTVTGVVLRVLAALSSRSIWRPPGGEETMDKIPMTAAGYATLEAELKHCQQVERPRIIQQITDARTHGDLSENAEYHAAKEAQSLNEGRIAELEDKLARAEVIDVSKLSGDTIKFGATVTLVDEDTEKKQVWQLVGETEDDAKQGRISITSPLARALLGKTKGANVEVVTPSGAKAYEIKKVEWR